MKENFVLQEVEHVNHQKIDHKMFEGCLSAQTGPWKTPTAVKLVITNVKSAWFYAHIHDSIILFRCVHWCGIKSMYTNLHSPPIMGLYTTIILYIRTLYIRMSLASIYWSREGSEGVCAHQYDMHTGCTEG